MSVKRLVFGVGDGLKMRGLPHRLTNPHCIVITSRIVITQYRTT